MIVVYTLAFLAATAGLALAWGLFCSAGADDDHATNPAPATVDTWTDADFQVAIREAIDPGAEVVRMWERRELESGKDQRWRARA